MPRGSRRHKLTGLDPIVDTKIIKTSYSSAAGTALVQFDKVRVPAKYIMGKENEGLKVRSVQCTHATYDYSFDLGYAGDIGEFHTRTLGYLRKNGTVFAIDFRGMHQMGVFTESFRKAIDRPACHPGQIGIYVGEC